MHGLRLYEDNADPYSAQIVANAPDKVEAGNNPTMTSWLLVTGDAD